MLHLFKSLSLTNKLFIQQKQAFANKKLFENALQAIEDIKDGASIVLGNFFMSGMPVNLVEALIYKKVQNLHMISVTSASPKTCLGKLIKNRQVSKLTTSFIGDNPEIFDLYLKGELELELNPLGNIAERIKSGGSGIPAFYSPTGIGTWVEEGKIVAKYKKGTKKLVPEKYHKKPEVKQFKGKKYLLIESLYPDFAFVKAQQADQFGNLRFRGCTRTGNVDAALSGAKTVIAEVEEVVEVGQLGCDDIHVPSIYIDRMVKSVNYKKTPEILIMKKEFLEQQNSDAKTEKIKMKIARRAAKELKDGMNVNLGIGIPTYIPAFLEPNMHIFFQGENGVLGMGDYPETEEQIDPDFTNPGKQIITLEKGASTFSLSQSLSMIRGGHLDMTIIGAMEVDKDANIASWIVPGKMMKGMGGSMDLTSCGSKIIVAMQHKDNKGRSKVLEKCSLPLTQKGLVDMLITEMGVYRRIDNELVLEEISSDCTLEEVKQATTWPVKVSENLKVFD